MPWVVGLLLFTLAPMIAAAFISMTDWNIVGNPNFVGLANYQKIFQSEDFYKSLWVTFRYAICAVPITILTALVIAILLNKQRRGTSVYRVIYYMPAIVSGVAVAVVFKWILDPGFGLLNGILKVFQIQGPDWLYDRRPI